jgi:hypothetical protein
MESRRDGGKWAGVILIPESGAHGQRTDVVQRRESGSWRQKGVSGAKRRVFKAAVGRCGGVAYSK